MQDQLPADYQYLVDSCSISGTGSEAVVHVNAQTEEEAVHWMLDYEALSLLTFRVAKTWPDIGVKVAFKVTRNPLSVG